jgi:predicted nucleotidyltransferase
VDISLFCHGAVCANRPPFYFDLNSLKSNKLTSQEKLALLNFVTYLKQSLPNEVVRIAIFGSKARGDSQPDSDIDVLVILDRENRELRRSILKKAARISLDYDVFLSPRIISQQRWEEMRGFTIYRNIIQDATEVALVGGDLDLISVETN